MNPYEPLIRAMNAAALSLQEQRDDRSVLVTARRKAETALVKAAAALVDLAELKMSDDDLIWMKSLPSEIWSMAARAIRLCLEETPGATRTMILTNSRVMLTASIDQDTAGVLDVLVENGLLRVSDGRYDVTEKAVLLPLRLITVKEAAGKHDLDEDDLV